jgi:hypothetical protein
MSANGFLQTALNIIKQFLPTEIRSSWRGLISLNNMQNYSDLACKSNPHLMPRCIEYDYSILYANKYTPLMTEIHKKDFTLMPSDIQFRPWKGHKTIRSWLSWTYPWHQLNLHHWPKLQCNHIDQVENKQVLSMFGCAVFTTVAVSQTCA